MTAYTMPAGKYYVGDLCYIIKSHADWVAFLQASGEDERYKREFVIASDGGPVVHLTKLFDQPPFEYKGHQCWFSFTKYGDGGYSDNYGRGYSVDAGLIGVAPLEMCEKDTDGGHIVEFKEPFVVSCEDGNFTIGDITIVTNGSDYVEEEYDRYLEEEESD